MQLSDHADDLFARDDLRGAAGVPLRGHIRRGGLPQLVTRTQTVADTANGLDGVAPIDGATIAAPIASLLTELYLTDTITRPALVDYVKNMQIAYPYYEKQRKGK